MLLELAIGDAYGAGFEYANEMIVDNNLSRYVPHPRHRPILGSYTDDLIYRKFRGLRPLSTKFCWTYMPALYPTAGDRVQF
jgi:hypothetical protein